MPTSVMGLPEDYFQEGAIITKADGNTGKW